MQEKGSNTTTVKPDKPCETWNGVGNSMKDSIPPKYNDKILGFET